MALNNCKFFWLVIARKKEIVFFFMELFKAVVDLLYFMIEYLIYLG